MMRHCKCENKLKYLRIPNYNWECTGIRARWSRLGVHGDTCTM